MKKLITMLVALSTVGGVSANGTGSLSKKERAFAINYLEETRYSLLKEITGLSVEDWNFKPAEDKWSIAQTVEHISIVENNLYHLVTGKLINSNPSPEKKIQFAGRDDQMLHIVADRPNKVQSPEPLKPMEVAKWSTPDEFLLYFENLRDRSVDFIRDTDVDLRLYYSKFTPMEELDAYQWIVFIGAHTKRHLMQINEIKEAMSEGDKSTISGSGR